LFVATISVYGGATDLPELEQAFSREFRRLSSLTPSVRTNHYSKLLFAVDSMLGMAFRFPAVRTVTGSDDRLADSLYGLFISDLLFLQQEAEKNQSAIGDIKRTICRRVRSLSSCYPVSTPVRWEEKVYMTTALAHAARVVSNEVCTIASEKCTLSTGVSYGDLAPFFATLRAYDKVLVGDVLASDQQDLAKCQTVFESIVFGKRNESEKKRQPE